MRIVWNLMTQWHVKRVGEINPARFLISDLSTVCFSITLYSALFPSRFKHIIVHTFIHPPHIHSLPILLTFHFVTLQHTLCRVIPPNNADPSGRAV